MGHRSLIIKNIHLSVLINHVQLLSAITLHINGVMVNQKQVRHACRHFGETWKSQDEWSLFEQNDTSVFFLACSVLPLWRSQGQPGSLLSSLVSWCSTKSDDMNNKCVSQNFHTPASNQLMHGCKKMQKKTLSNKTEAATNQESENSTVLEMEAENKYGGKEAIKQHEDKKENVSREIKVFFRRAVGARFPSALNTLVDSIYCCYKPTTDMWDGTSCKGLLRCNEITSQVLVTYHPQPTEDNFQSFSVEYQRKRSRFSFCFEKTGYRSGHLFWQHSNTPL